MEKELKLENGEYYKINGTKKILYFDEVWYKPIKDNRKRYSGWIEPLEKQPTIKSVELSSINELDGNL